MTKALAHPVHLEDVILELRGERVILDEHLAALYGVTTKRLNEQLKRNKKRFPDDFLFRLTAEEAAILRSQSATSSGAHGGRRYLPFAFTEHGAIMAANILNSQTAIDASVKVVRAFVLLRKHVVPHHQLARKIARIEGGVVQHTQQIKWIFDTLNKLMEPPERPRKRIGFRKDES
jgi:hypothetical protein